mmetsp:Transcript_31/g.118  ORF Transcript_31/g.118 Transcript_31/m.118 type:complete len:259 (+) Transcript_31:678-1454(+)
MTSAESVISARLARSLPTNAKTTCSAEEVEASRFATSRSSPPKRRWAATDCVRLTRRSMRPFCRKQWMMPPPGKAQQRAARAPARRRRLVLTAPHVLLVTSRVRPTCIQSCCPHGIISTLRRASSARPRSSSSSSGRPVARSSSSRGCMKSSLPAACSGLSPKRSVDEAEPGPARCVAAKSLQSADSMRPNSSGCQGALSSSLAASGVGKSTARRHCGGLRHTPSMAMRLADSKVQASTATSAGFSSSGKSRLRTSSK